ncbi:MAG: branched-chain amino acid ABC transporter permease [Anaerolinea sp.]|nr:branched-chain amino acid ABC transporter permease [Anaerolinea sp.]
MSFMRNNTIKSIFYVIATILLVLLPFYVGQYTVTTFIRIIYFGFLSLSMGFLIGQGGMVSLTQTAFFGLSGYIIGLFGVERGLIFPWPDLMAIGAVLILAFLFGIIAMRTHKIVFLMITLAFGQVCWAFAAQNTTILRGWSGIRGIRPFVIYGINFNEYQNFYWASLVLFFLSVFILWRITKSPFGLALNGIRENPKRMAAIGYPVYWIRVVAFLIAAVYAGLGGILAAYNTGIIMPTTIQLSRTIWVLLTVILGGASYFFGPIVGTAIAVWLDVLISGVTERYNLVIGVIFLLIVLFSPTGVIGIFDTLRKDKKFTITNIFSFKKRRYIQKHKRRW